ncbi:hypothetical protein ABZV91_19260 [Nocardia sp. NPDC004568]|uniref:hypothetical protein n=1 Tax=Nocardia sp. NPDC004568 TaxID=3154551 RepID=UPI0033A2CB97
MIVNSLAIHQLITLDTTRPHRAGLTDPTGPGPRSRTGPTACLGDHCAVDPAFDSLDEALRIRAAHSDHTPLCPQYLGAIAYLGGLQDDSYE